ncbi:MAG: LysE family translocator [Bacteroidota bacterium]|nr:LysE family translocator [Bacteroidota bacterium]
MDLEILIAFILSSTALTLMPGPDIIYVISQSVIFGKRNGVLISLGLVTGLLFHTLMVVFGLAAIINIYPNLIFTIKLLGSIYIVYLGFISIRKSYQMDVNIKSFHQEENGGFYRGLVMNLLNPKVSLFFLAIFPGFLFSQSLSIQVQFLILGFIFFVQALVIFIIVTILSNYFFKFLKSSFILRKSILKIQGIFLIIIAVFILLI